MNDAHLQFCADGRDISGSPTAGRDATEVRAWYPDSTLLGAVTKTESGWQASGSDTIDWTECDDFYQHWQAALAALLAVGNLHREVPEEEWQQQ